MGSGTSRPFGKEVQVEFLSAGKARWAFGMVLWLLAAGLGAEAERAEIAITNLTPDLAAEVIPAERPGSQVVPEPASVADRADLAASSRSIYERFSEVAKASDDEIDFQISEVTTYRPSQFDEVLWLGLFTAPGGPTIETVPHTRQGRLPSQSVAVYRSEWREVDAAEWSAQDFVRETPMLRASEALDRLAAWEPARYAGVAAVSSLAVTVHFQGRSRSYRALILWKPLGSEGLLFTLADWVVPGVDMAFHEQRSVVSIEELEAGMGAPQGFEARDQSLQKSGECFTRFLTHTGPLQHQQGNAGHFNGKHEARLEVVFDCSTSQSCNSTCSSFPTIAVCTETGSLSNPAYKHKIFTRNESSAVIGIGPGVGSSCGRALGCAVKSCFLGVCGADLQFGLSGQGAGINLRVLGSTAEQDLSVQSGAGCFGAVERPEDPNPCWQLAVSVVAMPLDGGRGTFELPSEGIPLRRLEDSDVKHHGQRIRYVMPEWALVSYPAAGGKDAEQAITLASSSDAFSPAEIEELSRTLALGVGTRAGASSGQGTALLVALPTHEDNSRRIPMPELQVADGRVPAGSGRGKVLVRADFADDFRLQALDFLHDTLGGVSHALALHIEKALSLRRFSDQEHRVVVFALLSVADSLEPEIVLSSTPSCCCSPDPEGPPCV